MKFEMQIEHKIELFNEILTDLGKPTILENSNFSSSELSNELYLELRLLCLDKNTIPMEIRISTVDLQIGLDRVPEVYEWSNNSIDRERGKIVNFIKRLLTSPISVEYCGSNYTAFSILDSNGNIVFRTPVIQGFYLRFNCYKKLFSPIYSMLC